MTTYRLAVSGLLSVTLLLALAAPHPALATSVGVGIHLGYGGVYDGYHPGHYPHRPGYGGPHYRRHYPYPPNDYPLGYYPPGYYPPGYYPPRPYPSDFRYRLPDSAETRVIGGELYYLDEGVYYQPLGDGFRIVRPPAGTLVERLPAGYLSHDSDGETLFERAGIWYRWEPALEQYRILEGPGDNAYRSGHEPTGRRLDTLPPEANPVTIDGVEYWHYRGRYYLHSWQQGAPVYLEVTP